jgi:5-methylcytosine-specific restriction protein A
MPWLFKRCNHPGCKNRFTDLNESYCETHRKERRLEYDRTQRDPKIVAFYKSEVWRRCRLMQLAAAPLCQVCLIKAGTIVDHIKPIRSGGERLDPSNLQSLCVSCHGKKHPWGMK